MNKAKLDTETEIYLYSMSSIFLSFVVVALQLAGPISIGETFDSTLIKFNRKDFSDLLAVDQEKPASNRLPSGLRHRGSAIAPATVAWEEQPQSYNTRSGRQYY